MDCTTKPPAGAPAHPPPPRPEPTGFPRHCHFLATARGDMRALGQQVGLQVYKILWHKSERGHLPVPADPTPLQDLGQFEDSPPLQELRRYPFQIQSVIDRFLTSDPDYPILVQQGGDWWLRGLPADPEALKQKGYLRQRAALTLSALGPLSQRQLDSQARLGAAAVRQAPDLAAWQEEWEQGCPTVQQVMRLIVKEKYNPGLPAPQLAAAIKQLGPAFCRAWVMALPQLDFIEDPPPGCADF